MPLPTASDTSFVICNSDIIVDTNADVNPTKGDIPTLTNADVYNSAMVLVDDLCVSPTKGVALCVSDVLPTKGDASCVYVANYCVLDALHVSDVPTRSAADVYNYAVISVHDSYVPLTKGDASCVSFVDYCVLGMDFIPPYFRPHFCDCTFSAGEGLVVVSLLSVSAPQAETDA